MSSLNIGWAIRQLDIFLEMSQMTLVKERFYAWHETNADDEDLIKQWVVIKRILDQLESSWEVSTEEAKVFKNRWSSHRIAALNAREGLARASEFNQNLGDIAPKLSASEMHPWIWEGASSLWQSRHYRAAVEIAIKKLNAETQNKIGSARLSETKLFQEVFNVNPPKPESPRLRLPPNDGSESSKSKQEGALAFAKGIFLCIRNPLAHEADIDISEQEALEYLAALSMLARWVDESEVVEAP